MMLSIHAPSVQWAAIAFGFLLLAVHQSTELVSQRRLLAELNRLYHPDSVPYCKSASGSAY
jgi:hypothetical protein